MVFDDFHLYSIPDNLENNYSYDSRISMRGTISIFVLVLLMYLVSRKQLYTFIMLPIEGYK
ncbi:MAG: hypothetical protein RMJ67_08895 [Elusimicrobiota bacterium]|nr:hypothetical protein [Endomicrobiia bacterium]MDW8166613.1 hypothetical protein [Elusimicrobiota bacterium]